MRREEEEQVNFRIPAVLKAWLKEEKERNRRSLTAEVVIAIQERKERCERERSAA